MACNRLKILRGAFLPALLFLGFSMMGCNLFKGSQGTGSRSQEEPQSPSPTPEINQPADTAIAVTPEQDTTETIIDVAPDQFLPKDKLDKYNVAILLPFLTNRYDPFDLRFHTIAQWSMQYYMGLQLSAEELGKKGMELDLQVHDTEGSPEVTTKLLEEGDVDDANLIFGPYRRVTIQEAAEFAKDRKINLVSPYSASSNITADNPHYIQAQPSMQTHCENLIIHALQNYRSDQIVLVGRNREIDRSAFSYFQNGYHQSMGSRSLPGLTEYSIDSETADFEEIDLFPFIDTLIADTTIFLVSAWTPEDETFVYSFLRKLELARQPGENGPADNLVVVYGTPAWVEYERTPLDYFEKFHLHVSSNAFINRSDSEVRQFERTFYSRFGTLPAEEAFIGYDLMAYFGNMLDKYGPSFEMALEKEPFRGLHSQFRFQRVVRPGSRAEGDPPIQQFENKFVNILQFHDYQFEPAPRIEN